MNQDYDEPIQKVFPKALHHECVFHALQWAQRRIKEVYGSDYAHTHPEAVDLKAKIYRIFRVFELAYRFTPFAKDNRPVKGRELDIRGKCPLELAGYDISKMPLARLLQGQLLGWPSGTLPQPVPSA